MTVLTLTRADAGYTGNGVLSGGNLTWTSGTGYNRVYSTTKKVLGASGGKYLIEFTFTTDGSDGDLQVGFVDGTSAENTGGWLGNNAKEIGMYTDGYVYQSSSNGGQQLITGIAAGDIIQFAIDTTDATNGPKVWGRRKRSGTVSAWNDSFNLGSGAGDPAAGTYPATGFTNTMTDYYLCLQASVTGDVFTVNFGATASAFPAVTGFEMWDATSSSGASASVTGIGTVGGVGSVTVAAKARVSVTGLGATGGVGSPTETGKANVSPTGLAGTASVGGVTATINNTTTTNLTGVAGTGGVGSVTLLTNNAGAIAVTGVSATGDVGTASIQGLGTTIEVTGVEASGFAGLQVVRYGAAVTVTGLAASGLVNRAIFWEEIQPTSNPTWTTLR